MTSPSNACGFRAARECACQTGECHQSPRAITAPVSRPSIKFSLAIIGFGLSMMAIAFISLSAADRQFHRQQLINQEASVQWK